MGRKRKKPTEEANCGQGQENPPTLILDDFDLKSGKITYRDEVPQEPINSLIQDITIKAEKLSTVKDSQGKLSVSMDFNKGKGFRRRHRARRPQPGLREPRCRS